MATPIAISLGALNLGTAPYTPREPMQWGSDAIQAALLTGDYRPEEMDEAAQSLNLVRQVTIPMSIRSTTADTSITDQNAITLLLGQANRYTPLNLTVTPTNSTRVSTFKVWGGSWSADYTNYSSLSNVLDGTLTLQCDPWIYGPQQSIGSVGSPLAGNVNSPSQFTVTPTTFGDVPADIQLFIKNGANPMRSMMVSNVSGNTTWSALEQCTAMTITFGNLTADAAARSGFGTALVYSDVAPVQNQIINVANWTTPTLPTDRPFRVYCRIKDARQDGNTSFRLRHVSGNVEIVGEWRTLSPQATANTFTAADMGAWYFPVSNVSTLGASSTTTFFEAVCRLPGPTQINFRLDFALYVPDESTVIFETSDTGKVIVAANGTAVVESDSVFTSTGQGAGGADVGAHIRSLGSTSYLVHTSQGYLGSLGTTAWTYEVFSAWAKVTPRTFNLA